MNLNYLYWTYNPHTAELGYLYSTFEISPYKDYFVYVHVKKDCDIKQILPEIIHDYVYKIDKLEEDTILNNMGINGKRNYYNKLEELGFNNYDLYAISITETTANLLKTMKTKETTMTDKVFDKSNKNEEVMYIILRSDLGYTISEQMTFIANLCTRFNIQYFNGFDYDPNIVILEATKDDLFKDNVIPVKYDNSYIEMEYVINFAKKLGHGNFVFDQPELSALGYRGIKRDIPKFVKRLPLFKFEK